MIKKEIHEKTKKLIKLLNLNNLQVAEVLGKSKITICVKLSNKNEKHFFNKKEYEMLLKYNVIQQMKIKNIDVL